MSRIPFAPFTEISAELGVAADTAAATACNRWNQVNPWRPPPKSLTIGSA